MVPPCCVEKQMCGSCAMKHPPADLTVVMPVYNNAAYLTEAVESLRRQTRPPRRIILIDDGSTDATPDVAATLRGNGEAPPMDYVRQENAGPAAAINRGAALADGELIAFHSADDVSVPRKFEWQLAALEDGADLVFGHMQNFI